LQISRHRTQQVNANYIGDCENDPNSMVAGVGEYNPSRIEKVNEVRGGSKKSNEQP